MRLKSKFILIILGLAVALGITLLTAKQILSPNDLSKVYYSFGGDTLLYALFAGALGITFNEVPANTRVPWMYVEFDNSRAVTSPQIMPHKLAVIGQMLETGTATPNEAIRCTSYAEAKTLFGAGSMLALMAKKIFDNNKFTEAYFFPLEDATGTPAAGQISIVASGVEAGTLVLYIGGYRIAVGVTAGQTAAQIATAIVAAITAKQGDLPVTAAVNGTDNFKVDITCNWDGSTGNYIDIRLNYYYGEATPGGVTPTITQMAGGATDPDVADVLANFGNVHYTEIVNPYTDSSNLATLVTEMTTRNGATIQLDGYVFCAADNTLGNLSTLGNSRNSQFIIIMGYKNAPSPPYEWAAALAAKAAFEATNDPARPVQTVELVGILPPVEVDRFTLEERNILLFDGISTYSVDANNAVRIERLITTYKTNVAGADDVSYLNWETMATLSYCRYDFRNTFLRKYPRFKLADDGNRYPSGQQVLTPKAAKAEAIAIFLGWQELGLVENVDAFKEALIVERDVTDRDRLNFDLSPDLINQFRVGGAKIGFIL